MPISLLLLTLFTGCSANYKVSGEFPTPLVEPIPAIAQLEISDSFRSYTFEENRETKDKLSIELGEAQTQMFETVVAAMFTDQFHAATEGANPSHRQLTIKPSVLDFQYAIPRETQAEIYEIWIKYRLALHDETGRSIADWQITGYGKTPTAFLKSPQEAIQAASIIALRDVGSQLSIGFKRQPDIQRWLEKEPSLAINLEAADPV